MRVTAAIDNVEAASEGVRQERSNVGGRLGRLNARDGEMRDAIVGARTRQGEIEDADVTQVLIELALIGVLQDAGEHTTWLSASDPALLPLAGLLLFLLFLLR